MKKAVIIYAIFFALTIAIPCIVCFANFGSNNSELVNIFR